MPASLRSDYPIKNLMAGRPFCPDQGVTFTGIRTYRGFSHGCCRWAGLDDAMIQPYSGHASRQSLEIYSRMSLAVAQEEYDQAIKKFPV